MVKKENFPISWGLSPGPKKLEFGFITGLKSEKYLFFAKAPRNRSKIKKKVLPGFFTIIENSERPSNSELLFEERIFLIRHAI